MTWADTPRLDARAPTAQLMLRAPLDRDLSVRIEVRAQIGAKAVTIMNAHHVVGAGRSRALDVSVADALALDAAQVAHATRVSAAVAIERGGRPESFWYHLPARYLALEGPSVFLLSEAALLSRFPGGVTQAARRAELAAFGVTLNDQALAPSGVFEFEPSPTDGAPDGAQASRFSAVTLCIKYGVAYIDRSGGDYWTSARDKKGHGVLVEVRDAATGRAIEIAYADPRTGCLAPIMMRRFERHTIIVKSHARVSNGNFVTLYDTQATKRLYQAILATTFAPGASGTYDLTWQNGPDQAVNIFAAATFSLYRRYGGTQAEHYYLYNEDCPGSSGSCRRNEANLEGWPSYSVVFIGAGLRGNERKFIISHELGHAVSAMFSPNRTPPPDRDTSLIDGFFSTHCADGDGHTFVSEEWQTGAIYEGFAQYYAATVWNDSADPGCEFYYYRDVDLSPRDGVVDPRPTPTTTFAGRIVSCSTGRDFIQVCYDEAGQARLLPTATEFDWLRFFWDAQTAMGLSFGQIANIWRDADPDNWTSYTLADDLHAAAVGRGVPSFAWRFWAAANGVHF